MLAIISLQICLKLYIFGLYYNWVVWFHLQSHCCSWLVTFSSAVWKGCTWLPHNQIKVENQISL